MKTLSKKLQVTSDTLKQHNEKISILEQTIIRNSYLGLLLDVLGIKLMIYNIRNARYKCSISNIY